ncbi:unnamed protein product [Sympodiomycopsis kandeliae]
MPIAPGSSIKWLASRESLLGDDGFLNALRPELVLMDPQDGAYVRSIRSRSTEEAKKALQNAYSAWVLRHILTAICAFDYRRLATNSTKALTPGSICHSLVNRWAPLEKPHDKVRRVDILDAEQAKILKAASAEETFNMRARGVEADRDDRIVMDMGFLAFLRQVAVCPQHKNQTDAAKPEGMFTMLMKKLVITPQPHCEHCAVTFTFKTDVWKCAKPNPSRVEQPHEYRLEPTNLSPDRIITGKDYALGSRCDQASACFCTKRDMNHTLTAEDLFQMAKEQYTGEGSYLDPVGVKMPFTFSAS